MRKKKKLALFGDPTGRNVPTIMRPCPFCSGEIAVLYLAHPKKVAVAACTFTHASKTCKRWERANLPGAVEADRRALLRFADRATDEARETLQGTRKPN